MRALVACPLLVACYQEPDLPLIDDVPIESTFEACAEPREEWAECVLDGDTFKLVGCSFQGQSVRLLSLDAPEIAHDPDPADCWGDEAHDALRELLEGERVWLEFDTPQSGRSDCLDAYDRELAWVFLLDEVDEEGEPAPGTLVNEWLLENGHARRAYDEFGQELVYRSRVDAAEERARSYGRGLWGACEGSGAE